MSPQAKEDAAAGSSSSAQHGTGVYICDLLTGIPENELGELLSNFGKITDVARVDTLGEEALLVEYSRPEEAEEAQSMLNYAALRGKTCRCMFASAVKFIHQTMVDAGVRLVIENLDPRILSRGLWEVCCLFGEVLDCKVEMDEDERSRCVGFVHYANPEDAAKVMTFIEGMRIGQSAVEVRRFEEGDAALFTGCAYALPPVGKDGDEDDTGISAARAGCAAEEQTTGSLAPAEKERQVVEHFRSLQHYQISTLSTAASKFTRLKELLHQYDPNHERQMVIIARSDNVQAVSKVLAEMFDASDFACLTRETGTKDRETFISEFEVGNLFVLLVALDGCMRNDFGASKAAAYVVDFDLPNTVRLLLYSVFGRANVDSHVHSFFSPTDDSKLARPLLAALEAAGHEIPPALIDLGFAQDA